MHVEHGVEHSWKSQITPTISHLIMLVMVAIEMDVDSYYRTLGSDVGYPLPCQTNDRPAGEMGGYFSTSKRESLGSAGPTEVAAKAGTQSKRMCKYRVVYLERNVNISEHPMDLRALFVLRRTG